MMKNSKQTFVHLFWPQIKFFGTLNKSGSVHFVLALGLLNYSKSDSGNTIKYDDDNDSYSD